MSTLTADPGFRRGTVLGVTWKLYDAEPADGSNLVGGRKVFRDEHPTTGVVLSNHTVDCIAVRNTSGAALLPGQSVELDATLTQVTGLATDTSVAHAVVDEYLPAAGAPNLEVLWVVVKGPSTLVKTAAASAAGITAKAVVSTTSTAGSVAAGTGNRAGFALATAASTATSLRVYVQGPLA
jgi:hypothetical protein